MAKQSPGPTARSITLEHLSRRFPHIPPACGTYLAQAGTICLDGQGHASGVKLQVKGSDATEVAIKWRMDVTEPMRRFWKDPNVAVEEGAVGIAILLVRQIKGLTVVERAETTTGVDWWLGTEDDLFQTKARLEVSGIMKGDEKAINNRVSKKKSQTKQSDSAAVPALIVVVEFGTPRSTVAQR